MGKQGKRARQGRHRRNQYEIRVVSPALGPAVARRLEDGRVLIDVDAALCGQEREEAIEIAQLPYERGWRQLLPVSLLSAVGDHPRTAATAVAGVGAAAAIGMATLTITGEWEPPGRPHAAATTRTVEIVPASPATPTPSPLSTVGSPDSALPSGSRPAAGGREEPAVDGRSRPSPASEADQPATAQVTPTRLTGTAAAEPVGQKPPARPAPSSTVDAPHPTRPPATSAPEPTAQPEPTKQPPASSPPATKPPVKIDVDVDLKDKQVGVEVGVGDVGVKADVDDLKAKVGDVAEVDVKDGKVGVGDVDVDLKGGKVGVGDLKIDLGKDVGGAD